MKAPDPLLTFWEFVVYVTTELPEMQKIAEAESNEDTGREQRKTLSQWCGDLRGGCSLTHTRTVSRERKG